ncbi:MAG: hypothetical protein ABJO36_12220 [Litorimonas sp.]
MTEQITRVFICEMDSEKSLSQKLYLEASDFDVEIIKTGRELTLKNFNLSDVILLEMRVENKICFDVLNRIAKLETRPHLLLTTLGSEIFEPTDLLGNCLIKVLLEPFLPSELASTLSSFTRRPMAN